jgi:gluconate 5-dehydrogenase
LNKVADFLLLRDTCEAAGGHAAGWETSNVIALHPETVELDLLPAWGEMLIGAGGRIGPRDATAAFGQETLEAAAIVVREVRLRLNEPECYRGHANSLREGLVARGRRMRGRSVVERHALFDLTGKTALVTGGNGGIGLGMARGLASAGAAVAIVARDPKKNLSALKVLQALQPECQSFIFDLAQTADLPGAYDRVSEAMGGIDILVNNAGTQRRGRADRIDIDDFEYLFRINVTAVYALSQCFARERMAKGRGGCIIMTASLMSEAARRENSAYTATKGAIRQLVRALAVDWAPFDIRVNGIGPGYVRTELTRALWEDEQFDQWVESRTPMGRWARPDDYEGAAVFLASEAAAFVTGQILYVDGGWLATF